MKLKLAVALAVFSLLPLQPVIASETGALKIAPMSPAQQAQSASEIQLAGDGICGWYVILGCSRTQNGAWRTLNRLGGPGVGGWAGAQVVRTNDYPNFRNGWFCVADGPYSARWEAESIAWREAVPDAYVKAGC
ncbi:MAG: hypothetical protein HKN60_01340 [Rhizobiales bacterium]|nr:hypothetical protein [Hyphomicrobiales bacterium]